MESSQTELQKQKSLIIVYLCCLLTLYGVPLGWEMYFSQTLSVGSDVYNWLRWDYVVLDLNFVIGVFRAVNYGIFLYHRPTTWLPYHSVEQLPRNREKVTLHYFFGKPGAIAVSIVEFCGLVFTLVWAILFLFPMSHRRPMPDSLFYLVVFTRLFNLPLFVAMWWLGCCIAF